MGRNVDHLAFIWRRIREGILNLDILRVMVHTRSNVAMLLDEPLHSAPRPVDSHVLCMNAEEKVAAKLAS